MLLDAFKKEIDQVLRINDAVLLTIDVSDSKLLLRQNKNKNLLYWKNFTVSHASLYFSSIKTKALHCLKLTKRSIIALSTFPMS